MSNSTIRSILKKGKLNGSNFLDWYRKLRIVLGSQLKLNHIEETLPKAPPATVTTIVHNAYTHRLSKKCLELSRHFMLSSRRRVVSTYVLKMKGYMDQMECLSYPMPLVLGLNLILTSLLMDYEQFIQNYNMHSIEKTIPELHAMLKLAEKCIPEKALAVLAIRQGHIHKLKPQAQGKGRSNDKGKLAYIPKKKIPPPTKKKHLARDAMCHHCQQNGSNFLDWYRKLRIVLGSQLKLNRMEETLPEAPPATVTTIVHNAYTRRFNEQYEIACLMLAEQEMFRIVKAFHAFKQEEGQSVSTYVLKMKGYMDQMECLKKCIPEKALAVLAIRQGHIHKLKPQAQGKGRSNEKGKLAYVPKKKIPPPTKKKHLARDAMCHRCQQVDKTPYGIWHEKVPNRSYLKVWGCEALVKRDTPNKLESKYVKCIFVGYPKEMMGYYFHYQPKNKTFVAHEHHPKAEHENVKPQSDVIPIRRFARIPQEFEQYGFYVDAEEHELGYHELSKTQGPCTPTEVKRMKEVHHCLAVGSIVYAVRCTRPDVPFSQNLMSTYQHNPGERHWAVVKNILKYLQNTKDMFLFMVVIPKHSLVLLTTLTLVL
nr:hypothetical protein [Tanacetum cinerariifolium]